MKQWFIHVGSFLLAIAVLGVMVMVSGIVPIKASSGHLPLTKWLLSFSMSRSVATYSIGIDAPDKLDDPSMVMKGAGHFETGCAPCHGSPARRTPRVTQQLAPTPPALSSKVADWKPTELFYITKHGVKFTGMPSFPSQERDDEVWAVVAFLLELPELDESAYRELVFVDRSDAPENTPHAVVESCAHCHGFDGRGRGNDAFPNLAGLHRGYFLNTMQAYVNGDRHSGIMEPIAARLSDHSIREIADYYVGKAPTDGDLTTESPLQNETAETTNNEADLVQQGEVIARDGLPDQDVGACIACHPLSRSDHNPKYPNLVGQPADYLVLQLELLKNQRRGGSGFVDLMHPIASGLETEQAQAVAAFYSSAIQLFRKENDRNE